MSKVIAIANQKGGCAKTTTAVNLSIGLAMKGQKVLVIDADGQADLTKSLLRDADGQPVEPDTLTESIVSVMNKIITGNGYDADEAIIHHPEGVDLMPSKKAYPSARVCSARRPYRA